MKKKRALPSAYAELTKDVRIAGTYEVFVPVPDRARPHRVAMQFDTKDKADAWIHSPEGEDTIAEILGGAGK
jgi:hypothetical protein